MLKKVLSFLVRNVCLGFNFFYIFQDGPDLMNNEEQLSDEESKEAISSVEEVRKKGWKKDKSELRKE